MTTSSEPRFVLLWASRDCRMASLFPVGGPPRHAIGSTVGDAWRKLALAGWLAHDQAEVLESLAQAALDRALVASLVGFTPSSWQAHVVGWRETWDQEDRLPERALAHAIAKVTVHTPVEPPKPTARPATAKPVATTLF